MVNFRTVFKRLGLLYLVQFIYKVKIRLADFRTVVKFFIYFSI